MTRRVFVTVLCVAGPTLALSIACQDLSPYPPVYSSVYQAGSQGPTTTTGGGGGDAAAEDAPPAEAEPDADID
jgi:hypothetical protein